MGINPDRLLGDLAELSTIGGRADGGVDRVAWGAADLQGRQWLKGKLEAAGWHAFTDPALNVFGRASDVRRRRLLLEIADAQRASEHLQDVAGFIELHIEQGPRLEAEHAPVAVVSVPTAMILVPSRGGVTHAPGEATADEDLVNGARVLLRATRHAARTVGLAANRSIRQASRPS